MKPFDIPKRWIWDAYREVKANRGAAGIDCQSLEAFERDRDNQLYKIWNRMSSGSYFPPPVRVVDIPKSGGGTRSLGIPTVGDRIAQTVVKRLIEPKLEAIFHGDSYGYRPHRSAHDAVAQARHRCWRYAWALDVDIQSFFDNIDHELMMRAVRWHVEQSWVCLYIERWLKAQQASVDGTRTERTQGTPQGGVISPLLANLFLHYAMDKWLEKHYPNNPFERYADDIVIHGASYDEMVELREALQERLEACGLTLHPDKTRIVYCQDDSRPDQPDTPVQFDFLGFSFCPRMARTRWGRLFLSFLPAISETSAKGLRKRIKRWRLHKRTELEIEEIAARINPIIEGWFNYYGRFYKSEAVKIGTYLNRKLALWAKKKYKRFKGSMSRAVQWLKERTKANQDLMAHWQQGIYWVAGQ